MANEKNTKQETKAGAPLVPISNFYMNGTEVTHEPALPPIGKLSTHCVCLVGTAPKKAADTPYSEVIKLDSYAAAMQALNSDGSYEGTLPAVVEFILTRYNVPLYVIIEEEADTPANTLTNVVGGVDADTGIATGIYKIMESPEPPTIIYAPSFTDLSLAQKLSVIANNVKAFPVIDGVNTNKLDVAKQRANFGGIGTVEENLHIAFPAGLYQLNGAGGVAIIPSGARLVAALCDVQMWVSPQGALDGCQDNTIPVGYNPSAINSEHNDLNKYGIMTFCKSPLGGIRCTGNRAQSGTFTNRVGLYIALSRKLIATSEIYKGKMLTRTFVESIVARLNSWIKTLKVDDKAIVDARVIITDKNTVDSYRSGSFYLAISYGDYSPLEHFSVTLSEDTAIVEKYVEELKQL